MEEVLSKKKESFIVSFSQEYSQRKDRHLLMREAAAGNGECSWQGRKKTSELSAHQTHQSLILSEAMEAN